MMARLNPQFLPVEDFPERGMPDMAFTSSASPEPQDQPASVHPSTQHLHDTGFGPIAEVGDEPMRSEWRLWVVLAGLCALWFLLMVWLSKQFSAIIDWVSSLA
jgi:hypothetical protein